MIEGDTTLELFVTEEELQVFNAETSNVVEVLAEETTILEVESPGGQGIPGPPGISGTGATVFEIPVGIIDGVNMNFATSQPFADIAVYLNGLRLVGSGNDYVVTGANTFAMSNPPLIGDALAVEYII